MTPQGHPFKDHFSAHAADYAVYRPAYPPDLVDFLAQLTPAHELAWDCGCGSGQLSVLLPHRFDRVVATDASAAQLATATPHPRVTYRCAPAEASGLPSASVDLAVAALAAHWFDLAAYYTEVRRVTRSGSAIALITYGLTTVTDDIDALVHHFYTDVAGPCWPPERRHVEDGYRAFPFPFTLIPSPRFEMRTDWTVAQFLGYVRTWSATQQLARDVGERPFEHFSDALTRAWGDHEPRRVTWPITVRAGRL